MGKAAKIARNQEEAKKAESQARQQVFLKEVEALSEKYRVDMVAGIEYRRTAIVPTIVLVDVKDKYEAMTAEAKKMEELKKQAQDGILKNGGAEKVDAPKLEV